MRGPGVIAASQRAHEDRIESRRHSVLWWRPQCRHGFTVVRVALRDDAITLPPAPENRHATRGDSSDGLGPDTASRDRDTAASYAVANGQHT